MDKTVVVLVRQTRQHPLYGKVIRVTKRYKAHDETNACKMGDQVRIVESRPYQQGQALGGGRDLADAPSRSTRAPLQAEQEAGVRRLIPTGGTSPAGE